MNNKIININTPLDKKKTSVLRAGDLVYINGTIYTARDAAHKKLYESLQKTKKIPIDLKNQIIYYTGPTPAKPNRVIGSAGPTTSYRMDLYTPLLITQAGLMGMIGKGSRNKEVIKAMKKKKAVYFAATGGAGALLSKAIIKSEVILYNELGTEAIRKLEVKNFPVIVAIDSLGNSLYSKTL